MTRLLAAALAGLVAGLSASPAGPAKPAPATSPAPPRVAVVVDASGPGAAARLTAARAAAARRGAPLRAPRTLRDQLSVTSRLAAEGYGTIVGFGLEAHAAIAPLDDRVRYLPSD